MSEIRYDRLYDTHVIIAPERLRKSDFRDEPNVISNAETCPFCSEEVLLRSKEIFSLVSQDQGSNGWLTRVIPNRANALAIEALHCFHEGNFGYWDGFGAHEIIIDSPKHHTSIRQWNAIETENWLKTLRERIFDLRRDSRLLSFSIFKNDGRHAGAMLEHCHTQLIALPFVPKSQSELMDRENRYYETHHHSLIESILSEEEIQNSRIVGTSGDFMAICPYASHFPFEIMISSKRYVGEIDTLSDSAIGDLSLLIRNVLGRLEAQLDDFSCNILVSTPLGINSGNPEAHRLIIRILPRIYRMDGFHLVSGIRINPVAPEHAVQFLKGENNG